MAGIAELALGAAPIAGGAMLGALAGAVKGPDFRVQIKSDMELLDKIPEQNTELRTALQRSIDERVYELIGSLDRSRELRVAAAGYKGNWRDIVVFACALLFTLVWWNVPHTRSNWLITFIVLVILSVVIGVYAARGIAGVVRRMLSRA